MRYWLIRTQQSSLDPSDVTACLSWPVYQHKNRWRDGQMIVVSEAPPVVPEANDRVVLLRSTKRPSFIGLGHIGALYTHKHRFLQYEYVSVKFDTLLLENPVPLEYVRSQTKLGPLGRGEYITGSDAPTEITQEQWEAITAICVQPESPTPPFMRWTIEPGDVVERADLHDRYGGARTGAVCPSRSEPLVFVFLGARGTRAFLAHDDDHRMMIEVKHSEATAVYGHLREGRALRVFRSIDDTGKKVRYLGQFTVASDNPGTSSVMGQTTHRNRLTSGNYTVDVIIHAITITPYGATVVIEPGDVPVGRPFVAADESITVQDSDMRRSSPELHTAANRSHRKLQNDLASKLRDRGYIPLSPRTEDVPFDLAFFAENKLVIVEVKSLSSDNYVNQFRSGFGQVCEYAEHYLVRGLDVVPVLFMSQKLDSTERSSMAERYGVVLGWPDSDDWLTTVTQ